MYTKPILLSVFAFLAASAFSQQDFESVEDVMDELGFTQYRVRHHGEVARLEVPQQELARAVSLHDELQEKISATGYAFVALDLGGFRSGSLNETLKPDQVQVVEIHSPS